MTPRERVRCAFQHRQPDRVPVFEQTVCSRVASEIMGRPMRTGGGQIRFEETAARFESEARWEEYVNGIIADRGDLIRELGFDLVSMPWRHSSRPSAKLDDHTFLYGSRSDLWSVYRYDETSDAFHEIDSSVRQEGIAAIERIVLQTVRSMQEWSPPTEEGFAPLLAIARRAGGERFIVCGGQVAVPPDAAWLEACAERPDLVEQFLDVEATQLIAIIPVAARAGVHGIWGGGDLASNAGPLYSPAAFRRLILPRLKAVTAAAHEAGLVYVFRTDGNTWPIGEMLFRESGVDGYGEIDIDAGMSLVEMKKAFPQLTLWGGMSCGRALSFGTPDSIREQVRQVLADCAPGGGLIFGSSNSIHSGVPTRNYLAMLDAAREFGGR